MTMALLALRPFQNCVLICSLLIVMFVGIDTSALRAEEGGGGCAAEVTISATSNIPQTVVSGGTFKLCEGQQLVELKLYYRKQPSGVWSNVSVDYDAQAGTWSKTVSGLDGGDEYMFELRMEYKDSNNQTFSLSRGETVTVAESAGGGT